MPMFLVERNIPGADTLTREELRDISAKSNSVVENLGVPYTWHRSYAAGDKLYCIREADDTEGNPHSCQEWRISRRLGGRDQECLWTRDCGCIGFIILLGGGRKPA